MRRATSAPIWSSTCDDRAEQKFLRGDRIQATALNVLEALVEAAYTRDRVSYLRRANLGIEKLRFLFRHAADLHHLGGASARRGS
jgi:hypothetical protein